jgi:hypothetical protein
MATPRRTPKNGDEKFSIKNEFEKFENSIGNFIK